MRLDFIQTKLVGLTMELDLKTREYKTLCEKLEMVKAKNIEANDPRLLEVREMFQKNHDEIVKINRKIKELEEYQKKIDNQTFEKYDDRNLFKGKKKNTTNTSEKEANIITVKEKETIWEKVLRKIKKMLNRKG
jgi:hypothetical protein